jgi:putative peptidoglycan lipid II flippase
VLFERGAFVPEDTPKTAYALMAFAAGLPAFVLIKVFQPAFFAREDTRTPMVYAGINMVVNVVGSVALFFVFQHLGLMPHVGIAVATTLAAWINAAMLFATLKRHGDFEGDRRLARNLPLILLASLAMGTVVYGVVGWMAPYLTNATPLGLKVYALAAVVGSGVLVFAILVVATGVLSIAQLRRFTRRAS